MMDDGSGTGDDDTARRKGPTEMEADRQTDREFGFCSFNTVCRNKCGPAYPLGILIPYYINYASHERICDSLCLDAHAASRLPS